MCRQGLRGTKSFGGPLLNLRDPLFWEAMYDLILKDLGINRDADYYSCQLLDMVLSTKMDAVAEAYKKLRDLLEDRVVVVIGDSPGSGCPKLGESVTIAADAALEKCLDAGVLPDIVVTDLDGLPSSSLNIGEVLFVVHAHGDNVNLIRSLVPRIRGLLIGTAQYRCSPRVTLPGGFTDGDRAVFLAYYYGAKKVYLYGFSFNRIGRWVKPSGARVDLRIKLAKLAWSKFLLLLLKDSGYGIECLESGCEGWI